MKSRVFIGPVDVANNSITFRNALRSQNIKCDYYVYRNNQHDFKYTKQKELFLFIGKLKFLNKNIAPVLNKLLKYFHVFHLIIRYNTFIFNHPNSLLDDFLDVRILKFFKRKVIFIFPGCVQRDVDFEPDNPEYICNRCNDIGKQKFCLCDKPSIKKAYIQKIEKYSDYIIAQHDVVNYLKEKGFIWFYVVADPPSKTDFLKKHEQETIYITHFPSNPILKLSNIIIPVLEDLEKEFPNIQLILKSKIPHQEVLDELSSSHILVDALGASYGSLGVEAMARGNVVLAGEMAFMSNSVPDLPVVTATTIDLKQRLRELILNKELRKEIAKKSLDFYDYRHSPLSAGKYYVKKLNL